MSSSSTNKQPLLIDRPLHSFVSLGAIGCLVSSTDFNSVAGSGCSLLVDCSSNDGAFIDSISIVATQASTTASKVLVLLSTTATAASITAANTVCVASETIASVAAGDRTNISLPPICVPVPNLASPAATVATYPSETTKKNTGLLVPAGGALWVGISAAITAPSTATRVHVFAQGGFY